MTGQPEERLLRVRQWAEKADHDLRTAEHTLTLHDDECPFGDQECPHDNLMDQKGALLTFQHYVI